MNNSLALIGYVGQKPEVKTFPATGNKLVKFSIAVKEFAGADYEQKTLWIDVEAWNGVGDRVVAAISKGREVALMGRLATNAYTKTGKEGQHIEVIKPVLRLSTFHLCGRVPRTQKELTMTNS